MAIVDKLIINGEDVSYKKIYINGKQPSKIKIDNQEYDYPDYWLKFSQQQNGDFTVDGRGDSKKAEIVLPTKYREIIEEKDDEGNVISSTTTDYNVTKICDEAFYNDKLLTNITIRDNIEEMGKDSFKACSNLKQMVIPYVGQRQYIDNNYPESNTMSYLCGATNNLEDIVVTNANKLADYAFVGCADLKNLILPSNLEEVGKYLIVNNSGSMTTDDNGCILDTSGKGVFIQYGKIQIDYYGKYTLRLVADAKFIGDRSFSPYYNSNNDNYQLINYINTSINIVSIGAEAFYNCIGLNSVVIRSNKIKYIYEKAFYNCSELQMVRLPVSTNTLKLIDKQAFYNCTKLETFEINIDATYKGGLFNIGDNAFRDCTSLVLDSSNSQQNNLIKFAEQLGFGAFYNCTSLNSIDLPWVKSIGNQSFYNCSGLQSVNIGSGNKLESIGLGAFQNCTSLKEITLPFVGASKNGTSNTHFGYIFGASDSSENSSYVPTSLKKVTIKSGDIPYQAFQHCSSLTSMVIGDSVTSIGTYAFENCSSLETVSIGNNITSVAADAFLGCKNLEGVYIKNIESWCNIFFSSEYSNPLSYANNLYLNGELVTKITIPQTINSIGRMLFCNCTSVVQIVVPDNVETINQYAFYKCNKLESITLPFIGERKDGTYHTRFAYIFGANDNHQYTPSDDYVPASLKRVTITGSSIIGMSSFYGCKNIEQIDIPNSVKTIGSYAFQDCIGLNSIYYNGTMQDWLSIAKGSSWNKNTGPYIVYCTDGNLPKLLS